MGDIRVRLPNRAYWKEQINCQHACPVHTDSRGYVRAIAAGDYEKAYLIARGPNPLASICGRICGAPCEAVCRRGELDKPIAIRALKRFVCERFGVEARSDGGKGLIQFLKSTAKNNAERLCEDFDELLPLLQALLDENVPLLRGESVGIIGSGPAGLAAAHDLALLGAKVSIYEMESVLGGMLAVGVPQYRLPRGIIAREVETIVEMGVKPVTGCRVGRDISFSELREQHDCVVVAVGAKSSRSLDLPGGDARGVLGGVEFLRDVSLGHPQKLGSQVVVIGGGNVAYDVGRTVLRQIAADAARTAVRAQEVQRVYLCSLESLDDMPADDVEIIEGAEEGIVRLNSVGPHMIKKDSQGSVSSIVLKKVVQVFDDNHLFAPKFDESELTTLICDSVLLAVGQAFNVNFIDAAKQGLETDARGRITCDPQTGATSAKDVFIAGDLAYGTKLLIHAVASGKAVARAVYERLSGRAISPRQTELHLAAPTYGRERDYEKQARIELPTAPVAERLRGNDREVEQSMNEAQAVCEAGRCFDCGVNTIFDGEKCIVCGGCVDVCPQLCLRIVSADRLTGDDDLKRIRDAYLTEVSPADSSAIVKDETICIRCGLCAERCPTGAITMEQFMFREFSTWPTV